MRRLCLALLLICVAFATTPARATHIQADKRLLGGLVQGVNGVDGVVNGLLHFVKTSLNDVLNVLNGLVEIVTGILDGSFEGKGSVVDILLSSFVGPEIVEGMRHVPMLQKILTVADMALADDLRQILDIVNPALQHLVGVDLDNIMQELPAVVNGLSPASLCFLNTFLPEISEELHLDCATMSDSPF